MTTFIANQYRETAVLRHLLKHLRQRRLLTPYQSILARSGLQLEHPLVTELHSSMVLQGNWSHTEQLVHHVSQAGLFDAYLHSCQPHAVWKRLYGTDADGDVPSHRGGHAMCIDHANGMIYLLGGWDGQKSLDDFWVYDIKGDKWRILSHSTSTEKNGPGARSCHKIVFDAKTGCIYLLGRLSDADALKPRGSDGAATGGNTAGSSRQAHGAAAGEGSASATTAFCSEFYRYHTRGLDSGKWDFLTFDTAVSLCHYGLAPLA
jgi:muskelin